MYLECPRCHALFRIRPDTLSQAEGWVRCGECEFIFNGSNETASLPVNNDVELSRDTADQHSILFKLTKILVKGMLIILFMLILVAGGFFAHNYWATHKKMLVNQPVLRPWIQKICQWRGGCDLAPQKNIQALRVLKRKIYIDPHDPKILIISATILNKQTKPQPWPIIRISFANPVGQIVAIGTFNPQEYLQKPWNHTRFMPGEKPIHLKFSVSTPGQQALQYYIKFH